MMKLNFWNEACKYGAIIGLVMAVMYVIEQSLMLTGQLSMMGLMGLAWILATIAYIMLLYRFTKRQRAKYHPEDGFPLSHGFGFILAMILLSSLIKGVVEYLYRSKVIGYEEYIEKYVGALTEAMAKGGVPAAMESTYAQMFSQIQEAPEPSILATVWSSVTSNLIIGLVLGLILAAILARAPRPFGPQSEE